MAQSCSPETWYIRIQPLPIVPNLSNGIKSPFYTKARLFVTRAPAFQPV
ncbi:Uncharacterised protein [Vibrio cholerae]|nr:Uncharacterised protein [Vibrio cholerae]